MLQRPYKACPPKRRLEHLRPIRFLVPVVLQAKFLLQDIWRKKFDWDTELDEDLIGRWLKWSNFLPSINGLVVQRCTAPSKGNISPDRTELHVFGDASEIGFGAVGYIRFVYSDGTADVYFLISKPR